MNAAPDTPSTPLPEGKDLHGAPPPELLTPDGLPPVCSEEVDARSRPLDALSQGGFSNEGQQQVLSADLPDDDKEKALR